MCVDDDLSETPFCSSPVARLVQRYIVPPSACSPSQVAESKDSQFRVRKAHTVSSRRCGSRRPHSEVIRLANQRAAENPAAHANTHTLARGPLSGGVRGQRERVSSRESRVETAWQREWRGQPATVVLLMRFSDRGLAIKGAPKTR